MVKKAKLTKVVFNPKWPIILVGDDKGVVTSLKLSPNLRKQALPKHGQKVSEAAGGGLQPGLQAHTGCRLGARRGMRFTPPALAALLVRQDGTVCSALLLHTPGCLLQGMYEGGEGGYKQMCAHTSTRTTPCSVRWASVLDSRSSRLRSPRPAHSFCTA